VWLRLLGRHGSPCVFSLVGALRRLEHVVGDEGDGRAGAVVILH
jgi:hypothetical protein